MKAKKILLQNDTTNVLYMQAFVDDRVFVITLHGRMPLDRCDTVPPQKYASYTVNAAVQQCITAAQRLDYALQNKSAGKISWTERFDRQREAIIITFTAEKN